MFEDTLQAIEVYNWGGSVQPMLELDREIRKVLGHPEQLAKIEEGLIGILQSDASLGAKRFVCIRLGRIGSERSVDTLAKMLPGERTSDMARFALELIPDEAACRALRNALLTTPGKTTVGIINSLGARRDAEAVAELAPLLGDADTAVACAAAHALGQIGGTAADQALADFKNSADHGVRPAVLDARLAIAEQLRETGKQADAEAIYDQLDRSDAPAAIRRALGALPGK